MFLQNFNTQTSIVVDGNDQPLPKAFILSIKQI